MAVNEDYLTMVIRLPINGRLRNTLPGDIEVLVELCGGGVQCISMGHIVERCKAYEALLTNEQLQQAQQSLVSKA